METWLGLLMNHEWKRVRKRSSDELFEIGIECKLVINLMINFNNWDAEARLKLQPARH